MRDGPAPSQQHVHYSLSPGTQPQQFQAVAYGCRWSSDLPLAAFEAVPADGTPLEIAVRLRSGPPPARLVTASVHRMDHAADGLRFTSGEIVADTFRGDTIEVRPGPQWPGHLPPAFYGTVAAALLTWRGAIAMHASAVEVGGKGILICGASGAGKSTLTASLIAAGGTLISDDLSMLQRHGPGNAMVLYAGRRSMRLFPDVARMLASLTGLEQGHSQEGKKLAVVPPRSSIWKPVPLHCIVVLGEDLRQNGPGDRLQLLRQQRYRPKSFRQIPGHTLRIMQLNGLACKVPLLTFPALEARTAEAFQGHGKRILEALSHLF